MEDAHSVVLGERGECHFFGVYDGHSGQNAAKYTAKHLTDKIRDTKEFSKGQWEASVRAGFMDLDKSLENEDDEDGSGCTAVLCMVTPDGKFVVGNAGDSRCLLSRGGRPVQLSYDHKPGNELEVKRISEAGGFVTGGRVNGSLALSRAIGDFEYKQNKKLKPEAQIITAHPDVTVTTIQPNDDFVVLACDGIWDVMTNEEVIDFVRRRLSAGLKPSEICAAACDRCLSPQAPGFGCDNMTILIVVLKDALKREFGLQPKSRKDVANTAE
eukprot:TRINITY_DN1173_c0_g1_i2.p1 TRINITY_DN1173_c0_g1~~TRINITY_DN1173_c0_g1_i2.p1  ORF type:complete len:270 (+),score=31.70 TRINITY_DN1173_c0_g1_i2:75-884(+)